MPNAITRSVAVATVCIGWGSALVSHPFSPGKVRVSHSALVPSTPSPSKNEARPVPACMTCKVSRKKNGEKVSRHKPQALTFIRPVFPR